MKTLKFRERLSKLILNREKTLTWRLFDDKNLTQNEIVSFLIWETGKEFAKAKLICIKEKSMSQLTAEDWRGHERFSSNEEMYATYSGYYNKEVTENTLVKIIEFKLI